MHTNNSVTRWARLFVLILVAIAVMRTASAQPAFLTNALNFNGVNQYVSVPAAAGDELNSAFTVEAWVFVRNHATWARLLDFGNGPASNNVVCALSEGTSGHPIMDTYDGSTRIGRVQSSSALPLNTWAHLAFTCDGIEGRIFINGSLVATNLAGTHSGPRTNNYIGHSNWGDAYADADMGEYRLWNVARSQAQIQGSTNAALAGDESGLRLYYRFDGTSDIVTNRATATGSAYDGTLVNGPTRIVVTNQPVAVGPPLEISIVGTNVVVSWPATNAAFGVQYSTDLNLANWSVLAASALVSNRYVASSPIAGPARYYRLINPCTGVIAAPTLGPVSQLGITSTRHLIYHNSDIFGPYDVVITDVNQILNVDGGNLNTFDAMGFVDPASCVPGTLRYVWNVTWMEMGSAGNTISPYTAKGITGYRAPVIQIAQDAMPSGNGFIDLNVSSIITGLFTQVRLLISIDTNTRLQLSTYLDCQTRLAVCAPVTLECLCDIDAALPSTEQN